MAPDPLSENSQRRQDHSYRCQNRQGDEDRVKLIDPSGDFNSFSYDFSANPGDTVRLEYDLGGYVVKSDDTRIPEAQNGKISGRDLKATPSESSASGTFPGKPFNGMQIDYRVSGASIINSTDGKGFTTARTLRGTLGSGKLRISGTARMGNGYSADLAVKVWAGDKVDNSSANIPSGYPGFNEQTFDVAVPIPQGVRSGGFSIDMTGHYNAGDRGLTVSGDFARWSITVPPILV